MEVKRSNRKSLDMKVKRFGLLLSVLFSVCTVDGLYAQNMDSSEGDRQALMDLFQSTNGAQWDNKTGWSASSMDLSDDIWGVGVENINGELRVVHIDLQRGTKTPPKPFSDPEDPLPGNNVKGELPGSIGNLSEIRYFNVKQNFFTGSVPGSMANWVKAERILLSGHTREPARGRYNHSSGGSVLGQSKRILTSNKFSGELPEIFGHMQNLEAFESQQLQDGVDTYTGSLPSKWPQSLKMLFLRGHSFTGNIPLGLTEVSGLEILYLGDNDFSGNLRPEMGNWANMTHLSLNHNGFTGAIPPEWKGFQKLQFLMVNNNKLTTEFPGFLFEDGRNNWIAGFRIEFNNSVTGSLPTNVNPRDYPHWNVLSASYCDLEGPLPDWITEFRWIQLNLEHNNFSGDLPAGFHNSGSNVWKRLRNLKLQGNNLTGPLPQANPGPKVWNYYLENNNFTGTFSSEFGETTTTRPLRIRAHNNNLSGTVPANIADIKNLSLLYLDGNKFTPNDLQHIKNAIPGSVDYRDGNQDPGNDDGGGSDNGSDNDPSVGTPEPQSPANGGSSVSLSPTFEWSDVGADAYMLHISAEGQAGETIDVTGTTNTLNSTLDPDTAYEWKVRGVVGSVEGEWSNLWQFTTEPAEDEEALLPAPVQKSPDNNGVISQTPTFEWTAVEGADYYVLHSNRLSPSEMVIEENVYGTTFTPQEPLEEGTSYHWRVHAVSDSGAGEWSEIWEFKIEEEISVLPVPTLKIPADQGGDVSLNPTFEWSDEGADSYQLQISATDQSETPIESNVEGPSFTLPDSLAPEKTYEWKVRGVTGGNEGKWSAVWQFTTEQTEDDIVQLPAPNRIAPEDNGVANSTPTFEWTEVEGADYYVLHSNRLDPTEMVIIEDVNGTTYTPEETLEPGTAFHWRVHAVSDSVEGEWSDIGEFTTEDSSNEEITELPAPDLLAPVHKGNEVPLTPAFEWSDVGAENYILSISSGGQSGEQIDVMIEDTTFVLTDSLTPGTPYEWRVRGVTETAEGEWSELWSFETGEEADDSTGDEEVTELPAPDQEIPEHKDVTNSAPTLEWDEVKGAEYYILKAQKLGSDSLVIDETVTGTSFTPQEPLKPGTVYQWRVLAVANSVEGEWSETWEFTTETDREISTSTDPEGIPLETGLAQNYPNPFNPTTQIEYTLSELQGVSLKVYDMAGRQVAVLVDGVKHAGRHTATFSAGNLASGIYFYRFITDSKVYTKKMTLLK